MALRSFTNSRWASADRGSVECRAAILLITGLLTHQHQSRRRRSGAEDGLRGALPKIAPPAAGGLGCDRALEPFVRIVPDRK
jgi:hypothetical protein